MLETVFADDYEEARKGASVGTHRANVTGGMGGTLDDTCEMVRESGAVGRIFNATAPDLTRRVLLGEEIKCTAVMPGRP
ncbi:MAG: hypothetical protein LVQ95_02380 [Candidatus Micrarchaeales archaeon]|nr:hypothetical protein [Candidatus Micrarchaeales archaeon]